MFVCLCDARVERGCRWRPSVCVRATMLTWHWHRSRTFAFADVPHSCQFASFSVCRLFHERDFFWWYSRLTLLFLLFFRCVGWERRRTLLLFLENTVPVSTTLATQRRRTTDEHLFASFVQNTNMHTNLLSRNLFTIHNMHSRPDDDSDESWWINSYYIGAHSIMTTRERREYSSSNVVRTLSPGSHPVKVDRNLGECLRLALFYSLFQNVY